MADYSYDPPASKEEIENYRLKKELDQIKAELEIYKRAEVEKRMLDLSYSESGIEGHVECNLCFAMVRVVMMDGHRKRCI